MELNDHLREMLKELGHAINESISGSGRVHESIQRIRDEGYNLYMVLDAKVGVKKLGRSRRGAASRESAPSPEEERAAFRMNLKDLHFLRSVGIDPTVKIRNRKPAPGRRTGAKRLTLRVPRSQ
ncbi:MAG TPA: hypothetical protein VKE50_01500 [Thermoanaerobaculia bacterium]|nr:hypothetical protein [Thermoanaerobaculia bacterium]